MTVVSEQPGASKALAVNAAVLVDEDAFNRFHCILRHLVVGLVDQALPLCWLSADERVRSLSLGPVEAHIHRSVRWPRRNRELGEIIGRFESHPPTIVHAMSHGSYGLASALAGVFDADLVLQVSSLSDCDALGDLDLARVERFVAMSDPLSTALYKQLGIDPARIEVIKPGVRTKKLTAGFEDPQRVVTLLCTTSFERDTGVDRLIEAADALGESGHRLMVFLVGRGRFESRLRCMVRDRGLLARVTFGQTMDDPIEAMHGADVFVETSGVAEFREDALQAMASGLVVVSVSNPAVDHIRDGETAYVCAKPTAQGLVETLERVLQDHAAAHRLAESAQNYIREHHTVSAMAESLAATYRNLAVARATFPLAE